nr:FCD domain-containing protein [Oricola nitratireducens]
MIGTRDPSTRRGRRTRLSWRGAAVATIKDERLRQHGDVLEAIRDRDPDLARRRMETLLDDAIRDVNEALANNAAQNSEMADV